MNSVLVGIASGTDLINIDTMVCIMENMRELGEVPSAVAVVKSCYIHRNYDELVEKAISMGASHLMMVDTDMVIESEAMKKLLARNLDIVGGMYNKRKHPIEPIVKDYTGQTEPFEAKFVPNGCLLINLAIADRLPRPWFSPIVRENGTISYDPDVNFAERAREAGLQVWCDPTIQIRHIGSYHY